MWVARLKSSRCVRRLPWPWILCVACCAAVVSSAACAACPNGMCCPGGNCRAPLPLSGAPQLGDFQAAGPYAAAAPYAFAGQTPHPAVVRVITVDRDGMSLGSGTLIYATDRHGLVITNWHVVRDAVGQIEVVFPGGFHSAGTVIKVDNNWDLAAIGIWRPPVEPVEMSNVAPRPGEPLTIAGYGSGTYRAATGRCMQYVSPGSNFPFQIIELSAEARQGDSGGPIFNSRGQLAGVLLGSGSGRTVGSYCGRVGMFLADVTPLLDRQRTDGRQGMLVGLSANGRAAPPESDEAELAAAGGVAGASYSSTPWRAADPQGPPAYSGEPPARSAAPAGEPPRGETAENAVAAAWSTEPPTTEPPTAGAAAGAGAGPASGQSPRSPQWTAAPRTRPPLAAAANDSYLRWEDLVGSTRGEQAKSLLAGIGALAILLISCRVLIRI